LLKAGVPVAAGILAVTFKSRTWNRNRNHDFFKSRNRNRNFSKVGTGTGTGTVKNSYGSTTLLLWPTFLLLLAFLLLLGCHKLVSDCMVHGHQFCTGSIL
jgi:hypothetical protein